MESFQVGWEKRLFWKAKPGGFWPEQKLFIVGSAGNSGNKALLRKPFHETDGSVCPKLKDQV